MESTIEILNDNLPDFKNHEVGKILVTGATGYIGGQLVPALVERGYSVRVMVRVASPEQKDKFPQCEISVADAIDIDQLKEALKGIHTAYYLIHSLLLGKMAFEMIDVKVAENFWRAAEEMGVKRIVYLCGLGKDEVGLSPHLENRMKVAIELQRGSVPVTTLRAAIIVGSGSASYEILKNLIINSPIFLIPKWAKTLCQPISLEDVLKYLIGVMECKECSGKTFDVGGSDILSYEQMLRSLAKIMGRKRLFLPSFFSNTTLYGYFASLLTPVPAPITKCLMEGAKNEVICQNDIIKKILPFNPLSFKEAILQALTREEQDKISTRWSDAYPPAHELAIKLHEEKKPIRFQTSYSLLTYKSANSLFVSICKIGGKEGWFYTNWLWRLRGAFDRLLMGVGTARGRKSVSSLMINDVIDFWRVEGLKKDELLLLRAEMVLPGRAWLEFKITQENEMNRLCVKAYFQPSSWRGYIYWYNFLPFHFIIFKDLIHQIDKRS